MNFYHFFYFSLLSTCSNRWSSSSGDVLGWWYFSPINFILQNLISSSRMKKHGHRPLHYFVNICAHFDATCSNGSELSCIAFFHVSCWVDSNAWPRPPRSPHSIMRKPRLRYGNAGDWVEYGDRRVEAENAWMTGCWFFRTWCLIHRSSRLQCLLAASLGFMHKCVGVLSLGFLRVPLWNTSSVECSRWQLLPFVIMWGSDQNNTICSWSSVTTSKWTSGSFELLLRSVICDHFVRSNAARKTIEEV